MAYSVSNDWITKSYSGESLYSCRLSINNKVVPITQISKIDINSPIIDNSSQDKPFYIGTFISQSITIKFRNLKGLNIVSGARVDLYIGQTVGDNDTYEEVPIGKFLIDDLAENYEQTCEITCLDYGVLCSTNCDYSSALDTNTGDIEIDDLFEWMCGYYGLEFEPYPSINGTVKVGSYDSTQSGKFYLSCIAEIKGCNVKMSRLGKIALIPIKSSPTRTVDALKSKSWELGEKYVIKKVTYFDAIRNYSFGGVSYGLNYQDNPLYYEGIRLGFIADKGNELIIRQDNPFIVDETVVQNIYNAVKDLEIWSLKCENYGDLSLDAWDIVTYTLGEESYNTFYNNTTTYEMTVMSTNNVQIPNKQQEVTTNVVGGTQEQKIRRVSTEVNNIDGKVAILAQEQSTVSSQIADLTIRADSIQSQVTSSVDSLSSTISTLQNSTSLQINAINQTLENGVEKLSNSLVRIDTNGINTSRSNETFNTQITNKAFEVKDSDTELAFLGYDTSLNKTVARIPNLETSQLSVGYHRSEKITEDGDYWTADYYIGGDN